MVNVKGLQLQWWWKGREFLPGASEAWSLASYFLDPVTMGAKGSDKVEEGDGAYPGLIWA